MGGGPVEILVPSQQPFCNGCSAFSPQLGEKTLNRFKLIKKDELCDICNSKSASLLCETNRKGQISAKSDPEKDHFVGPLERSKPLKQKLSTSSVSSSLADQQLAGCSTEETSKAQDLLEEQRGSVDLNTCMKRLEEVYRKRFGNPKDVKDRLRRTLKKIPSPVRLAKLISRKYGWGSPVKFNSNAITCRLRDLNKIPSTSLKANDERQMRAESAQCNKCDGKHMTSTCPFYKKARLNHPDAKRRSSNPTLGSGNEDRIIDRAMAKVHKQPGDGSCLFHSLRQGLGRIELSIRSTQDLRRALADWVNANRNFKISDTPIRDWVRWDTGCSVDAYTRRMCNSAWGGGIELAACANKFRVRIQVWERCSAGFKRISCFQTPTPRKTVNVLYCGGIHYDFLELVNSEDSASTMRSSRSDRVELRSTRSFRGRTIGKEEGFDNVWI